MSIRYDDRARLVELSVGDLVAAGARGGHLALDAAWSSGARMRLGQEVHADLAAQRRAQDPTFRAEVTVTRQIAVDAWTVTLHGRVDGLAEEDGHTIVEEVKTTSLPADVLLATGVGDWPDYVRQLEAYLWMVAARGGLAPIGRLVLVSVVDGSRHVLGVAWDAERVEREVRRALVGLVRDRERRLAWLASRRSMAVPWPFDTWRPGQRAIADATTSSLERGVPLLVEAPTGLGKTMPVLWAALRFARAHDMQVFWATQRTTQQRVVQDAVRRLRRAGASLRAVTLGAKEKVCLNEVVACRPEGCRFAEAYYDKLADGDVLAASREAADPVPASLAALALHHTVCPFALALDTSEEVDLVIGDVNYVFEPGVRLDRHFAPDPARGWVVVVDEAHGLVERARGWGSPRVTMAAAEAAARHVQDGPLFDLAEDVADAILAAESLVDGPVRGGVGVADLPRSVWRELAARVDVLAVEHARQVAAAWVAGAAPPSADPWVDLARSVTRLAAALEFSGEETAHLVGFGAERFVGLACLDPAPTLRPRIAALGGFVGCSATLTPFDVFARLLGLPERTDTLRVPSPFPPENRAVVVAPRVSTAYRDRRAHADATAALLARVVEATPGNVALYFPSFAMLRDIVGRMRLPEERVLLAQVPAMDDSTRTAWLERLAVGDGRVVLAAVLGGVFAEGVDLPAGALSTVCVVGPGLPPVGLERDLLRDYHDRHDDDGFRYASLVPGLTRVVQAAGRLHRRPEDRGVIVLVGRRFRWRDVRELLPETWQPDVALDPAHAVAMFFGQETV